MFVVCRRIGATPLPKEDATTVTRNLGDRRPIGCSQNQLVHAAPVCLGTGTLRPATVRGSVSRVTTQNPFPGMNPFFEQQWRDAHTMVTAYLRDALQERLPADLVARAEEESVTVDSGGGATSYRPDIQIQEPWTLKQPAGTAVAAPPPPTAATGPIRVFVEEETERWIEIHDLRGRLITVIELLSPSNKRTGVDRDHYLAKRRSLRSGGANVVEIDLVRQGASVFPDVVREVMRRASACYGVCVFRAALPAALEVYPIGLRERLPVIRVPLRPSDADVPADLQPLIDQCHERGRYHLLDYRADPDPPFPPEAAVWVDQVLREGGLR